MASPAARTSSPAFPALRAHGIHSGVSGQRSAKAEGGRGGRPGSAPPLRRVWEEQVVLGAGVFAGSGWSEQTLGGQGWAPEAPTPSLFLSANLVRSGRRGGHPAKLAGRRPQSPGTCAWQGLESTGKRPRRPHPHLPARPPVSRRGSRSSSLYDGAGWPAAGRGNARTRGVGGKAHPSHAGETHRRTRAAWKAGSPCSCLSCDAKSLISKGWRSSSSTTPCPWEASHESSAQVSGRWQWRLKRASTQKRVLTLTDPAW